MYIVQSIICVRRIKKTWETQTILGNFKSYYYNGIFLTLNTIKIYILFYFKYTVYRTINYSIIQ